MNLHEYQAKALFKQYGIPTPAGEVAASAEDAVQAARALGGGQWVIKAQVHAGGRGKAGGVKLAHTPAEAGELAGRMLGMHIQTYQTGGRALPVNTVLVAEASDIAAELYLSVLIDRSRRRISFVGSAAGGVDIEQVAAATPEKIFTIAIDPTAGLQGFQCRRLGFALGLNEAQIKQLTRMMGGLYRLFVERDLALIEVNPLVIAAPGGDLLALDAKINVDDNALYRQADIAALRDESQEDPAELEAGRHGLNYITLDGDIACMVNGAGLAMATMDEIQRQGGRPANFLDVGGGANAARVAEAFKIILGAAQVKAILVNIFGGIVRCDLVAEGIVAAVREVHVKVPVIVRLEGTNVEAGYRLLEASSLAIITAPDLERGARLAVEAARGANTATA